MKKGPAYSHEEKIAIIREHEEGHMGERRCASRLIISAPSPAEHPNTAGSPMRRKTLWQRNCTVPLALRKGPIIMKREKKCPPCWSCKPERHSGIRRTVWRAPFRRTFYGFVPFGRSFARRRGLRIVRDDFFMLCIKSHRSFTPSLLLSVRMTACGPKEIPSYGQTAC